jgi:hypothetical protein
LHHIEQGAADQRYGAPLHRVEELLHLRRFTIAKQ